MARKNPDRPLYITQPRDLDKLPEFRALSRDAQWLLQYLERDPYRLSCGVFVLNVAVAAREAKATIPDVLEWFAEVVASGWAVHDEETGEVWLTAHMGWDFTLSSPNGAKGVLRDLKRVHSDVLASSIERLVFERYPSLNPSHGINPSWSEPPPDHDDEPPSHTAQEGGSEGGYGEVAGTPEPKHNPEARTPKPEAHSRSTEPEAHSPTPKHEAPGAPRCERCDDLGIYTSETGTTMACTCRTAAQVADQAARLRAV